MGALEEGGKAAAGFMDAMKQQPLALALVIMNMALLLFFYIILERVSLANREREARISAEQKEIREMLSKCVVPSKSNAGSLMCRDAARTDLPGLAVKP